MAVNLAKHYFTVSEYERMGESGIFAPEARVELIEGEIVEMSPIGSRHAACVRLLARTITKLVGDNGIVSTQSPGRLNDFSEPQPDVAILRFREDFYRDAHPEPSDVFLIIEVADTTIQYDRHVKMPLYASAGIAEALIFNLPDDQLEVYWQPEGGVYQKKAVLKRGEQFSSAAVTGLLLNVEIIPG